MLNHSPFPLDLLKALGVHLYESWDVDTWGDPYDVCEIYAERERVPALLQELEKNRPPFVVKLFEGPPPPF